ncbi:hypothetical protein ACF0H5_002959 [Mactra antiquata]
MANLFLTDIPNSAKKSTETIYEIKAPLATFDTIDLDDWDEDNVSRKFSKSTDKIANSNSKSSEKISNSNSNKQLKQDTQVDVGIGGIEKVGTAVDKDIEVTVDRKEIKKSESHKGGEVNDKIKTKKSKEDSHNANVKESKKKSSKCDKSKSEEVKVETRVSNSGNTLEKPKHKEHGASSVKSKLGKILKSPKSDSKSKVGELMLKTGDSNGDKKVNNRTPVKTNGNHIALPVTEDIDTPTPTEDASKQLDNVSVDTLNSESENNASGGGSHGDLMDPNSSENNASAEDIQTKLKLKGRKHKEKASNVKYEKIGSLSDVSDQEKSECGKTEVGNSGSSFPRLELKTKGYDSDSDSSDSDSGYIRRGYIANVKGIGPQHLRSIVGGNDAVDSDSTPCSSPKISRPLIPPPLSKEDAAKLSKRKAYEKRLQRLQVTTTPIERPRSTTPINIHGLEEYINISSPERSPAKGSHEKLKIKLPLDDLGRSPRHLLGHRRCASGDGQIFNFNEELLFTHTKSAILLEDDGHQTKSPKRILVPPTLSPKLSPAHLLKSPRSTSALDPNHPPKYFFNPKSPTTSKFNTASVENTNMKNDNETYEDTSWAKFDDFKSSEINSDKSDTEMKETPSFKGDAQSKTNDVEEKSVKTSDNARNFITNVETEKNTLPDLNELEDEWNNEEILTVNIVDNGETKKCDIECHMKENVKENYSVNGKTDKNNEPVAIELNEMEQNSHDGMRNNFDEKLKLEDSGNGLSKGIVLEEDVDSLC